MDSAASTSLHLFEPVLYPLGTMYEVDGAVTGLAEIAAALGQNACVDSAMQDCDLDQPGVHEASPLGRTCFVAVEDANVVGRGDDGCDQGTQLCAGEVAVEQVEGETGVEVPVFPAPGERKVDSGAGDLDYELMPCGCGDESVTGLVPGESKLDTGDQGVGAESQGGGNAGEVGEEREAGVFTRASRKHFRPGRLGFRRSPRLRSLEDDISLSPCAADRKESTLLCRSLPFSQDCCEEASTAHVNEGDMHASKRGRECLWMELTSDTDDDSNHQVDCISAAAEEPGEQYKAKKRVRFAKANMVWKPQKTPLPPLSLRTPPSATPRGSALKPGVLPGPICDPPKSPETHRSPRRLSHKKKSAKRNRGAVALGQGGNTFMHAAASICPDA